MFTDRELLELAAKAAGLEPDKAEWTQRAGIVWIQHVDGIRKEFRWNPIDDDGDALRLAVRLGLLIDSEYNGGIGVGSASYEEVWECKKVDPYAATRRAIVRAAAEIGRQMREGGAK